MANGCSVTTASRKMMVRPASRMLRAISLGVFWRDAPSTSAIMRSRKVSPGFAVILHWIWSESTRVPPVTAERSPPASRITGADSPVIADSSTDATPSTISPSEGMSSPAETSTISPSRNFELGTFSVWSLSRMRLATVSDRALRSVSACALPRPSAIASAKFANSTVNHNHKVICRLNLKSVPPLNSSTVVITLPISTTNMTGLPIIFCGFSFTSASTMARRTIFHSQTALLFVAIESEHLPSAHEQVLQNRAQTQRRKKRERPHNDDHADQKHCKKRCGHWKSSDRRWHIFLARQIARDPQHRDDHEEAPGQHGDSDGRVVPERIRTQATEGRAVIASSRNKRIQNFCQSMRPGIFNSRRSESLDARNGCKDQDDQRKYQSHQHRHLHVVRFNLLAQIFRRASHHQPRYEHRQHDVNQNPVHSRANPTENHFAKHDVHQRHHAAQRRERIMPSDNRTTAGVGGHRGKQRRVRDSEANLFALHVPAGLLRTHMLVDTRQQRISASFRPISNQHTRHEQNRHGRPNCPAVRLRSRHPAKRVGETCTDSEDREHLEKIGKGRRVLKWVSAIGVEKPAPIRAEFLDDFLRGHRTLRNGLLGHRIHDRLAVGTDHWLTVRTHSLHLLRLYQRDFVVRFQVLYNSLRNQEKSPDHTKREKHPKAAANKVHPEISYGFHLPASNAANKGNAQHDAGRRGGKVVIGQPSHLGEITHRGFTRVFLPIRVRGERRRRIEREMSRCYRAKLLRIERQKPLNALDQIQEQHRNRAKQQHRSRVLGPAHLVRFVDPSHPVEQALDRTHHRIQKRPLAAEYPRHEHAHGLGHGKDQREKNQNLKPPVCCHFRSVRLNFVPLASPASIGPIRTSPDGAARRSGTPWSTR